MAVPELMSPGPQGFANAYAMRMYFTMQAVKGTLALCPHLLFVLHIQPGYSRTIKLAIKKRECETHKKEVVIKQQKTSISFNNNTAFCL